MAKITLTIKTSAMKSIYTFSLIAIVFASCTTAYKSGQTPDDVYYSPERPKEEYVRVEEDKEKYRYEDSDEDRYLRMKVRNYRRWSSIDDDCYCYNRYSNSYYSYNNPWNSQTYWNYYYNPYYGKGSVVVNTSYNKPRKYNLHVFDNSQNGNTNSNVKRTYNTPVNTSGNNNYKGSGSNAGNFIRDVFTNSNSNSNSGSTPPKSTSGNSSTNSGNTNTNSGSSGGNAPVRKF